MSANNNQPIVPLAVSDKEAARLLGLSKSTVRSHIKAGHISVARVGRRLLIPVASLQAFLDAASLPTSLKQ